MDLQEAVRRSQSEKFEYPNVFDINCGLGDYPNLGVQGVPSWGNRSLHKRRYAILEIRTFRGISSDAIHFYGKIIVDGVYTGDINNPDKPKSIPMAIKDEQFPLLNYKYELIIKRPITKYELESDTKRWGDYYEEGDLVEGYEDSTKLIEDAKKIMKLRFSDGWFFYYQTPMGKMNEIKLD